MTFFSYNTLHVWLEVKNSKASLCVVIVVTTKFFLDKVNCHKSWKIVGKE